MIPKTRMPVHQAMGSSLAHTEFSCTRYTVLYAYMEADALQALYWNWEVPQLLVHYLYGSENEHSYSLGDGVQSDTNGIFVHPLTRSVSSLKLDAAQLP